jgi:hypothetical protein
LKKSRIPVEVIRNSGLMIIGLHNPGASKFSVKPEVAEPLPPRVYLDTTVTQLEKMVAT